MLQDPGFFDPKSGSGHIQFGLCPAYAYFSGIYIVLAYDLFAE